MRLSPIGEEKKSMCDACQRMSDMRPCFLFPILLNPSILNFNILYEY